MSDYQPQKHTDFEFEDILKYLKRAKIAIVQEKYNLSMNREKNKKFSEDYNLTAKKIENIILNLEVEDFCYAVDNEKEEFSHEILYVFCSREELNYFGEYVTPPKDIGQTPIKHLIIIIGGKSKCLKLMMLMKKWKLFFELFKVKKYQI